MGIPMAGAGPLAAAGAAGVPRVVRAHAELVVRDAGPGIPPDERERVFQRFARGSTADGAGFGLGLAIGRELAERMGGRLVLEESGPPGAVFRLTLVAAPRAGSSG